MLRGLIVLAATTVATVATTVIVSNVKKQKEEKGKFEFKGLFEKAAAKQAAKDSVKAIKGGIRRYFDSYGWVLLILSSKEFIKFFTVKDILLTAGITTATFFICSLIAGLIVSKDEPLKEKISSIPRYVKEGFLTMIGAFIGGTYLFKDILTILVAYVAIKSRDPLAIFNTSYRFILIQLLMMLMPKMTVTVGEPKE